MRTYEAAILLAAAFVCTAAAPETITAPQARAVVDREIELVTKNYVFAEKRAGIVAAIRANENAGQYDLTSPEALADKLGADMMAVSHDKHMWMLYAPDHYAATLAAQSEEGKKASAKQNDFFRRLSARSNQGYSELRILPGNVRYANLINFLWEGKTPEAVTDAARFLAGGDAVIIDLRQNGGGSPDAVRAMISYFMPPNHQLLMTFHDGVTGKTDLSRVTSELGAPRMVGMPLYVLISGRTASAAEEFAYHVKEFKLGTLVGQTTEGAANNDSVYPIAPGFVASISTGRPVHPMSGTNWEGTGIAPDLAVPAGQTFDQAQLLALRKLAAVPGPNTQDYQWAITRVQADLTPPAKLDAAAMAAYAGTYGERSIIVQDGVLVFQRRGHAARTMTLLADDLFTLGDDDQARIRFHRAGGKIVGFDTMTPDGLTMAVDRS